MSHSTEHDDLQANFKQNSEDLRFTEADKPIKSETKIKSRLRLAQLKNQLFESGALLSAILDISPVSIIFTDLAFKISKTNTQFLESYGYNEREVISLSDILFSTNTKRTHLENKIRTQLINTESVDFESQTRHKNGELSYIRVRGKLTNQKSNPQVVWILEDISHQKVLAENLNIATSVYHVSGAAMLILDAHFNIININPAFTEITGFNLIEIKGKPIETIFDFSIYPSTREEITTSATNDEHWRGEFLIGRHTNDPFPAMVIVNGIKNHEGIVSSFVVMFVDISDHKKLEYELRHHAEIDPLTTLPNRKLFAQRLDTAIASANRFNYNVAILYLDLDGFKKINDSLGHGQGDNVLIEVAKRLIHCVREVDTVARLGGDEFIVILNGTSIELITETAQRILDALCLTIKENGIELQVSASIGIAVYPSDNTNPSTLVKYADEAMYRAKYKGKGQFCWHKHTSN